MISYENELLENSIKTKKSGVTSSVLKDKESHTSKSITEKLGEIYEELLKNGNNADQELFTKFNSFYDKYFKGENTDFLKTLK